MQLVKNIFALENLFLGPEVVEVTAKPCASVGGSDVPKLTFTIH